MSFHGREGEAWADWLAGYQRIYPPALPGTMIETERCEARPGPNVVCPRWQRGHAPSDPCECVLFGSRHRQHKALCGAVWGPRDSS